MHSGVDAPFADRVGALAERFSGSAVGPITVSTSRMIDMPLEDACASTCVE